MLIVVYATETVVGTADSQCAATFGLLAFRFLGMDGRASGFRVSMRGGFLNAAAGGPRRQSPRRLSSESTKVVDKLIKRPRTAIRVTIRCGRQKQYQAVT